MFSKVLVAIDGSSHAEKALQYALDLSKKYGSRVTLLHVVISPVYAYGIEGAVVFESDKRLEEEGKKILGRALELARSAGVEADEKMVEGHPAEEIVRMANEGGYDLMVIGSRGLGRVKSFLLGSISDRVSHYCKCPVLIVKP